MHLKGVGLFYHILSYFVPCLHARVIKYIRDRGSDLYVGMRVVEMF